MPMNNGNEPEISGLDRVEVVEIIRRTEDRGDEGAFSTVRVETNVDEDKTRSLIAIALMSKTFDYMEEPFEEMLETLGDDEDD